MRKIKSKIRRTIKSAVGFLIVLAILLLVNFLSVIPIETLQWFGGAVLVGISLWLGLKFFHKPEKYINERGYVVLTRENELEHRYIAKQLLGRDLQNNEVVHHINGKKTDNLVRNLCLMDKEKHEHFHSWLSWKKSKSGSYPRFRDQKRILVEEYGGILLETISPQPTFNKNIIDDKSLKNVESEKNEKPISTEISAMLFEELRQLRKIIAREKRIPAYMVFDDKTLMEIVEILPDTDELFLQVRGVGPTKLQMYGTHFLSIIKRYKTEYKIVPKNKKDSA